MEHWVLEPEVLKVYAKHYQTGETIPSDIVDKLDKASKFNMGFITVEYLAAALLDMEYHALTEPADLDTRVFEKTAMDKYGLIPEIKPRYRSTYFRHIFDGGYAAGYYSYIWCEILDADAFQAFKETGNIFNKEVAAKFENEILSKRGTRDPLEMYIAFRIKPVNNQKLNSKRNSRKSWEFFFIVSPKMNILSDQVIKMFYLYI
jgi:peptidyl-dipeptidase Dcp